MPKKKASKAKQKRSSTSVIEKFKSLKTIYKVFIVAAIIALAWWAVWYAQVRAEMRSFEVTKTNINTLAVKITRDVPGSKLGAPYEYCSYSSITYGRGERSCTIGQKITTQNRNLEEVNKLVNTIERSIGNSRNYNNPKEFKDNSVKNNSTLTFDHRELGANKMYCYSSYVLNENTGAYTLDLTIGCNGAAKIEYFPVQ